MRGGVQFVKKLAKQCGIEGNKWKHQKGALQGTDPAF
jgi:hypothetical protein